MYEYKSLEQIEQEYYGQWVYIVNCKHNELGSVIGGVVLLHGDNMNSVIRNMRKFDDSDSPVKKNSVYIRYMGKIPEEVALLI